MSRTLETRRAPEPAAPSGSSIGVSLPGASLPDAPPPRSTPVGVGVLGATGYAGQELIRLLAAHPRVRLLALGSRQQAGQGVAEVFPWTAGFAPNGHGLPEWLEEDATDPRVWKSRGIEVVFSALPHGALAARAAAFVAEGLTLIDLAADFRPGAESEWGARHGGAHPDPGLIDGALYGLTEWVDWSPMAADARPTLVANPGCYATAILLGALPVVAAGWWSGAPLVATALSGVSGAGRAPSATTHFVECGQGASPYRVGEVHAHRAEILAQFARTAPSDAPVGAFIMNPHLVPMARGIVATLSIPLNRVVDDAAARALFLERYAGQPFVRLLEGEALPETRFVRGSNRCDLAVRVVADGSMLLVFSALDNLVKGAAGQAVQNLNRLKGWPEAAGLPREAWPCG